MGGESIMVMARLHIICGNCGNNEYLSYEIDRHGRDCGDSFEPSVFIRCGNCSTIHALDETVKEADRAGLHYYEQLGHLLKQAKEIAFACPELNMGNYTKDQVEKLNNSMCEIFNLLDNGI